VRYNRKMSNRLDKVLERYHQFKESVWTQSSTIDQPWLGWFTSLGKNDARMKISDI
jgi:hypothetical protein